MLDELLKGYRPIGFSTTAKQVWFRGRICDGADGWDDLHELIYPRVTREFGRANILGRSAFYASWNVLTVMNEISAQTGQHVQLIAVRALPEVQVPCMVLGELTHLIHSGRIRLNSRRLELAIQADLLQYDEEGRNRTVFLDAFLSEEFRRIRVKPVEYKLTAAVAEIFYAGKGGVMYPSVETWGAQNLAVPSEVFDPSFEVLWTEVVKVSKYHGYGVYEAARTRFSCDFASDGQINWNSPKVYHFVQAPGPFREHVPAPGYVGWRVPKT